MKWIFLILFLPIVIGCKKEVAKKRYDLILTFEQGDNAVSSGLIYEKDKRYKNEDLPYYLDLSKNPDAIYIEVTGDLNAHLVMYKTNEGKLTGTYKDYIQVNTAKFANDQNIKAYGSIDLEGNYTRKGRKFIVENGIFEFYWQNAEDYGMSDQVLTGTWTLKRQ